MAAQHLEPHLRSLADRALGSGGRDPAGPAANSTLGAALARVGIPAVPPHRQLSLARRWRRARPLDSAGAPGDRRTVSLLPQPDVPRSPDFSRRARFALDSWLAAAVFVFHAAWFDRRVRDDEARLTALFGDRYREYLARVKRWIPGLL